MTHSSESQARVWERLRAGLPTTLETANISKSLDARLTLTEAIECVIRIVACYPNGGHGAGKSYIGALAANLARYPASVARKCADQQHGIVAECRFLPTVADVIAWCEREQEPLFRQAHAAETIAAQRAYRAEAEAEDVARKGRLSYTELKQRYGDWHHGWEPMGETARRLEHAARTALATQIGQEAYDSLPDR